MTPWKRHRREVQEARRRVEQAAREAEAAEARKAQAKEQAVKSAATSNLVRRQLELNGWTELLQKAWGSRA